MNAKQLRKAKITNMALWAAAIFLPIVARAFASKDPKIFDVLMPIWQFMLAAASTRIIGTLPKSEGDIPQNDVEAK